MLFFSASQTAGNRIVRFTINLDVHSVETLYLGLSRNSIHCKSTMTNLVFSPPTESQILLPRYKNNIKGMSLSFK